MPIKIEADAKELARVEKALERLRAGEPRDPKLNLRAKRGSLEVNLNALVIESGVKRHRIERLYPDLAAAANADRRVRTSSPSLRAQLDAARRDKQIAERRLEQSQTYTYRLMETISRLRTELQLEKDRVSELEAEVAGGDDGDALFFGTDDVPGFPPMPAKKKAGRARSRSHS